MKKGIIAKSEKKEKNTIAVEDVKVLIKKINLKEWVKKILSCIPIF